MRDDRERQTLDYASPEEPAPLRTVSLVFVAVAIMTGTLLIAAGCVALLIALLQLHHFEQTAFWIAVVGAGMCAFGVSLARAKPNDPRDEPGNSFQNRRRV